jgi:hypothetical protein
VRALEGKRLIGEAGLAQAVQQVLDICRSPEDVDHWGSIRSTSAAAARASSILPNWAQVAASQRWPMRMFGARAAHSRSGGSASEYCWST